MYMNRIDENGQQEKNDLKPLVKDIKYTASNGEEYLLTIYENEFYRIYHPVPSSYQLHHPGTELIGQFKSLDTYHFKDQCSKVDLGFMGWLKGQLLRYSDLVNK